MMIKSRLTRLPLLAGIVLLSGCSFLPEYVRPVAPVPDAWPTKVDAGNTAVAAVVPVVPVADDWRNFFTDPPLQALIGAALEHNRDLHLAVARVAEARALAGLAHAERFPGIDVGLQQQASRLPGDLNASGQPQLNRRYDANLGVAAFELDFWGRVRSLDTAAQASFLASDFAHQAFRLSLIADVAGAYYSLGELDARLALATATARSRAESRYLVERRRDVGLAGDIDFHTAEAAWATARAEVASLARQRAAAENALRLLVGQDVAVMPAPTFSPTPAIAVGLPAEVLLQRPDVQAAEQKLIAANAHIGAARAAFLPRITLTATAGTASAALAGLFGGGSGAWSFVPLLKWPLFDSARTAAGVDLATARRQAAVAEYEKTLQQAFREVADLLSAHEHYAAQHAALAAAVAAQGERLQRVEARHAAGVSSYLELLDAQREHFAVQQAALGVQRAQASTAASLFKALGGAGTR
jgi:outer membrane protein, multidrug efflux system